MHTRISASNMSSHLLQSRQDNPVEVFWSPDNYGQGHGDVRGPLSPSLGMVMAFSYFQVSFLTGREVSCVDLGGLKFWGTRLGLDEPHSCLQGGDPPGDWLWARIAGAQGRNLLFSIKYFIIYQCEDPHMHTQAHTLCLTPIPLGTAFRIYTTREVGLPR